MQPNSSWIGSEEEVSERNKTRLISWKVKNPEQSNFSKTHINSRNSFTLDWQQREWWRNQRGTKQREKSKDSNIGVKHTLNLKIPPCTRKRKERKGIPAWSQRQQQPERTRLEVLPRKRSWPLATKTKVWKNGLWAPWVDPGQTLAIIWQPLLPLILLAEPWAFRSTPIHSPTQFYIMPANAMRPNILSRNVYFPLMRINYFYLNLIWFSYLSVILYFADQADSAWSEKRGDRQSTVTCLNLKTPDRPKQYCWGLRSGPRNLHFTLWESRLGNVCDLLNWRRSIPTINGFELIDPLDPVCDPFQRSANPVVKVLGPMGRLLKDRSGMGWTYACSLQQSIQWRHEYE